MEGTVLGISQVFFERGWIVALLAIAMLLLLILFSVNLIYKRLAPKIEKTHLAWDSALLEAIIRPLRVLIIVVAVTYAVEILGYHFENATFSPLFSSIRDINFIVCFIWLSLRFIKNMEIDYIREKHQHKKKYDKTTVRAVCQISRIGVILIGLLIFLQTLDINISAVLAFGGAGGIVVGLAAKDLLANFFGGLVIYLDRPFNVGDWVRSPDREIEGFVENIGWRLTCIRTFSKRPLYVPNGVFSNISVENPSRMTNRQINTRVGIRYADASKMDKIVHDVEEMVKNHPEIDTNKFLMVRFDEFGPSSLNFLIYCFTKTTKWADYLLIQQDVYLKTIEIIHKNEAQCALPTTTLHVPNEIRLESART